MQRAQTGSKLLVPPGVGWLAGWIIVVGRLPLHLGRVGNMHSAPRDSTCSGVRCRLSHLSLLMDMQAPVGCRRQGGIGRPTSDSPDQLLQNMRRCIQVGGGARRPSFGLMGIPSLCRRVGGHWGLARCRRSQEARRRRGRLRLRRESNGAAVKRSFPQMSKCRTGNDLQGESKKHIPARIRLAVDTRALTPRISLRGDDGSGKKSPKESLCGHYRLRLPLAPLVPLASMNWARCAPPPATDSATPSLLEIVTSRMHFDSITHLHYLASLSSVATGLLRPCPVTRRAVPSSMSQEGQDLLTDEKRRPSGPEPRRARLEKTHAYVRDPEDSSCPPLARHPLARRRLDCPIWKEKGSWRRARWLH